MLAAGAEHLLVVTTAGALYVAGVDDKCQLGIRRADGTFATTHQRAVVPVDHPAAQDGVIAIAAGGRHSLFLSALVFAPGAGVVYGMGDNACGQLGPPRSGVVPVVTLLRFGGVGGGGVTTTASSPSSVSSGLPIGGGGGGVAAVASSIGTRRRVDEDMRGVREPVIAVAAGFEHSVLRGVSGRVYTCGKGSHGELGQSSSRVVADADPSAIDDASREGLFLACARCGCVDA